jgi:long-subunit fatty acid transport protein
VEANAGPQFNFVNPGARSLGMGGAFIGLADDSTAAYTNPAGLGQLTRREFSAEVRYTRFNTTNVTRGRLMDAPTGVGLDTISGLQEQETESQVTNLSFISMAFPFSHGTFAVYRHELANFEADFDSEGPFGQTLGTFGQYPNTSRFPPTTNNIDLKIANYGFAGSWRAGSHWMLGGSLNYYQFDFDTLTRRFNLDADGDGTISAFERLSVKDFRESAFLNSVVQKGNDSAVGYNLGVLWMPNDKFSVGAVYRNGPEFEYDWARRDTAGNVTYASKAKFKVPSVWGLGFGYRPTDAFRLSLDANRVNYSEHAENVIDSNVNTGLTAPYLKLKNTTEIRLGAEYTEGDTPRPFSIRFGLWHEPAHRLAFDGTLTEYTGTPLTYDEAAQNGRATLFTRGDSVMHYTAGFGMVFKKFQIDSAIDVSKTSSILSLSLVYFVK